MNDEINAYEELLKQTEFGEYKDKIKKCICVALLKYYDNNKKIIEKDKKLQEMVNGWFEKYCDYKNLSRFDQFKISLHKKFNFLFRIRYKISSNSGPIYGFIKKIVKKA